MNKTRSYLFRQFKSRYVFPPAGMPIGLGIVTPIILTLLGVVYIATGGAVIPRWIAPPWRKPHSIDRGTRCDISRAIIICIGFYFARIRLLD